MNKVEHIGIAVSSLDEAIPLYEKLLNTPCYKTELVDTEKVNTAFFKTGHQKIELLESTDPDGVTAKFIAKKGKDCIMLPLRSMTFYSEMKRLEAEGFVLLQQEPKKGADNKLICFLHPKFTQGVLIEICQEIRPSR
jgi:methylmalonyl-CoA/ethylmalonyl-CoA epimerase